MKGAEIRKITAIVVCGILLCGTAMPVIAAGGGAGIAGCGARSHTADRPGGMANRSGAVSLPAASDDRHHPIPPQMVEENGEGRRDPGAADR